MRLPAFVWNAQDGSHLFGFGGRHNIGTWDFLSPGVCLGIHSIQLAWHKELV